MCKETIPLVLFCEKSTNAYSLEKIKKCVDRIGESVRHCLTDDKSFNVKIIVYTVSSDIDKCFLNPSLTENFNIQELMQSSTISFSRIYEVLAGELSRSAVLEGIESLACPVIILIADGSSQYIKCGIKREDYYSQNRFLKDAKKIVFSIGEPSIDTRESFEFFAGKDGVLVFNDDTAANSLIEAICCTLCMPCVSTGMRIKNDDWRSFDQDILGIVEVDPFDEEIEACTDDTDWGSNQDWKTC